jgi:predicted phage-related endonuclease
MAHLDREVVGQDVILECKTAGEYMSGDWGEEFTAEVPQHYLLQCLHYLCVTGKSHCHLAVLIGGNKHRIYVIKAADFAKELAMIPRVLGRFWERVQAGDPPGAVNTDDLALMFPHDNGAVAQADQRVAAAVSELRDVKAEIKALGQRETDLKFEVCSALGAASTLAEGDRVLATYKGQSRSTVDVKKLRASYPAVAEECTTTSTTRTLVLKKAAAA